MCIRDRLRTERTPKNQDSVLNYNDYIQKIKDKYGNNSKEFLLAKIYEEFPARDDFSGIILISNKKEMIDTKNYIVVNQRSNAEIILNSYKTASKYGSISKKLSKPLTILIRGFIKSQKIQYSTSLFPSDIARFISKMNEGIGEKGGINLIRHMVVSTMNSKANITEDELLEYIRLLGHKTTTFNEYIRPLR